MASNTGENDVSLRKITDMTRLISVFILALHFYYYCYDSFQNWHLTSPISDRILEKLAGVGLFSAFIKTKLIAITFLTISLLGVRGKKEEKLGVERGLREILSGVFVYTLSYLIFALPISSSVVTASYMTTCTVGFLLILSGGTKVSRVIIARLSGDIFNKDNETFPQYEELLENEYSINLPAQYRYNGKVRNSWINIINPFRGLIVSGSPGVYVVKLTWTRA